MAIHRQTQKPDTRRGRFIAPTADLSARVTPIAHPYGNIGRGRFIAPTADLSAIVAVLDASAIIANLDTAILYQQGR